MAEPEVPASVTATSLPSPTLPKGGAAIRGIGETFAANPSTGTGSIGVPIATSPGRSGFGPHLVLSYDSGSGNGPFGFGWSLSVPAIARKTDKGLPRYRDAEESDVYVLAGAEDLVPADEQTTVNGFAIRRYRPRIEGLFARIERWTALATGEIHWRSISRDNVTTLFGTDARSRVGDPGDPARVFTWLACESYDDKGNAMVYEYVAEDDAGVDRSQLNERNRVRTAQRYLKRVRYGNRVSRLIEPDISQAEWLFEVVFDYDEGHVEEVEPDPARPAAEQHRLIRASAAPARAWPVRPDPFSSHRAGFEVRTYRRCRRVLMFHHIPDLPTGEPGYAGLVRSTEFGYADLDYTQPVAVEDELAHSGSTRGASKMVSIGQAGYAPGAVPGTYVEGLLPTLELIYSQAVVDEEVRHLDPRSLANLPAGIDGSAYQWADLDGEGVAGILTEQAGAWLYKANLGDGRFGALKPLATAPLAIAGDHQLLDLAGDGQVDVVSLAETTPGFYERTEVEGWAPFRAFRRAPEIAWSDPNLRFVDLVGDGHVDVLITEQDAFRWHASLGEDGFGEGIAVPMAVDEERGPRAMFADSTQSVHLADMSGDGLADLVRIRNADVCYWPNQGYGRFGPKVALDNPPWFDRPDRFDQRRIRLADVDGSGTTDIIYLAGDGARIHFNQSGNRLTGPRRLPGFPAGDDAASVVTADLLGNGTACLVWSAPQATDAWRTVRYVDLMGGVKPHLLVGLVDRSGTETRVRYAPSTRFYLADKAAGRPWVTRLPFPVHVVERVETLDRVSGNRFVTRYAYHHGCFDGDEREFRGFGLVEQWDTEQLPALGDFATNEDASSHSPPLYTRTWFHTGRLFDRARISAHYADEYYRDGEPLLDDTVLAAGLSADEEREACRALKGSMLRQEVFALDGTVKEPHPYTVTEQNFTIRPLAPRVFLAHSREAVTYHYERDPADPRIGHALTLEVDDFGNVLASAAVGYGRRHADPALDSADQERQAATLVTYTEQRHTNAVDDGDDYRAPLPAEVRTFELTGVPGAGRFGLDALRSAAAAATTIPYEAVPTPASLQKRLIEHVRTLYRRDDLSGPLPIGALEPRGLAHETYRLALTPGLVGAVYGARVTDAMLVEGGHVQADGGWWQPSGQVRYSPGSGNTAPQELDHARAHFFLTHRVRDPFGTEGFITQDPYDLLVEETLDALGNRVTAAHDYRVLAPALLTDPDGNRSAVVFDALGLVAGTAVMGKPKEPGDRLTAAFRADLTRAEIDQFLVDPRGPAAATLLGDATTRVVYDLDASPALSVTLARETHAVDAAPAPRIQVSFSYWDGLGRQIQQKLAAEPDGSPRWVGSGWTVYDNKNRPVRRYEPFFTATHEYESDRSIGVSPILCYDPPGRAVVTLQPDHAWETVRFEPWREERWDVNDTVLLDPRLDDVAAPFAGRLPDSEYLPSWHDQRAGGALGAAEQEAASKAAVHAGTPSVAHADALGRTFLTVAHNRFERAGAIVEERHPTRVVHDVEGNEREVRDAADRLIMRYAYDMLGQRVGGSSMESGERLTLHDVGGTPIRSWDSREHVFRSICDVLRRPVEAYVREGDGPERLVSRTVYGEDSPAAANARGRVAQQFDQAGVLTNEAYDFKGNLLRSSRRLAREYTTAIDWSGPVDLEPETFASSTSYDALNRPTALTAPDQSVHRPTYNDAGLLETLAVNVRGAPAATGFVADVDYDAKGRRTRIAYANGVVTQFAYDALTFRLVRTTTTRASDQATLQDLSYTYDPVGNVTRIEDAAQDTIFFGNQVVTPRVDYAYDAVYRLVEATGREHIGQMAQPQPTWDDAGRTGLPHPGDGQAMRRYAERYEYDAVGNIMRTLHQAAQGSWTRTYGYEEPSLLEPGRHSNRLSATTVGSGPAEPYAYDAHGNTTSMPHLPLMRWDEHDRLQATARQSVNAGSPETTYYVYDPAGRRVRKATETANGVRQAERIYLDGFEVFRSYNGGSATVALERQTVHVMDGRRRVALIETRTHGSDAAPARRSRYQLGNHLDSASLELSETGQLVSYEEFFPYGSTSYQAGPSATEVSLKRYRYTGMERDEETGFAHHGARYFVPWLGRWLSSDPAGLVDGTILYAYSRSNPIRYVDSSGTSPDEPPSRLVTARDPWELRDLGRAEPIPTRGAGTLTRIANFARNRLLQVVARTVLLIGDGHGPTNMNEDAITEAGQRAIDEAREGTQITKKRRSRGGAGSPPEPSGGTRLVTPEDLHAHQNLGNAEPVPLRKELVTSRRLWENRNLGNAEPVTMNRPTPTGSSDPGRVAGTPEPTRGASPSPATGESAETRIGVGKGGAFLSAGVSVAITTLFTFAIEGRAPSAGEVAGAAYPPLALVQAKNHDDTVIPILTWFGGPMAFRAIASVPLLPQVGMATVSLTYGVPQASARGMAAHMLGAKGGYANLLCYPGKPGCR